MKGILKARIRAWLIEQVGIESIDGAKAAVGIEQAISEQGGG
jgi:hypothetical protein